MALDWGGRRRLMIIGGAVLIGLTLLAGIVIAVMYDAPSCMDGKMNQDEGGVDCGGSCAYLCRADVQAPRIEFARPLDNGSGRTDVIAYVDNRNAAAEAEDVPYVVEVFDESGTLLGRREGMLDLPARAIVPLYLPGVAAGIGASTRAFVSFGDIKWRTPQEEVHMVHAGTVQLVPGVRPRVTVVLENASAEPAYNRTVVATAFDAEGEAIAASQTVVREVAAYGTATAVFTWPSAFSREVVRIEVAEAPSLP